MPRTSVMHVGVHPGKNEPCSMPAVCGAVAECLKAHFEARFLLHFKPCRVSRFRCLWERLQRLQPVTPCNSLPLSEGKKSCLKVFRGDGPLARRKYKTLRHILLTGLLMFWRNQKDHWYDILGRQWKIPEVSSLHPQLLLLKKQILE